MQHATLVASALSSFVSWTIDIAAGSLSSVHYGTLSIALPAAQTSIIAYIGPGSGLMGVVVFFASLAALAVAFIGFLWYPVKAWKERLRSRSQTEDEHPWFED